MLLEGTAEKDIFKVVELSALQPTLAIPEIGEQDSEPKLMDDGILRVR
jgi:hypothetical protein